MIAIGLDTETTGLDPAKGHRIIELCLQIVDVGSERTIAGKTWRFHPGRTIDLKAQAVHGISLADLAGCPTFDEVAPKVQAALEKADVIVAHNAGFDIEFLHYEFEACGLKLPNKAIFCTMENGRWACPDGKVPKLGELCWAMNVDYDASSAHAADYDVDCMMKALLAGIRTGHFQLPEPAHV